MAVREQLKGYVQGGFKIQAVAILQVRVDPKTLRQPVKNGIYYIGDSETPHRYEAPENVYIANLAKSVRPYRVLLKNQQGTEKKY